MGVENNYFILDSCPWMVRSSGSVTWITIKEVLFFLLIIKSYLILYRSFKSYSTDMVCNYISCLKNQIHLPKDDALPLLRISYKSKLSLTDSQIDRQRQKTVFGSTVFGSAVWWLFPMLKQVELKTHASRNYAKWYSKEMCHEDKNVSEWPLIFLTLRKISAIYHTVMQVTYFRSFLNKSYNERESLL